MKKFAREAMKESLLSQTEEDISEKSRQISAKLLAMDEFRKAKEIFIYVSAVGEVQTGGIISAALAAGKAIYCPAVRDNRITAGVFGNLRKGSFGIMEPEETS